jgi:hypothetical protein
VVFPAGELRPTTDVGQVETTWYTKSQEARQRTVRNQMLVRGPVAQTVRAGDS